MNPAATLFGEELGAYARKHDLFQMRMVPMMPNELLELTKYPPEKLDELGVDFSQVIFGTGGSVFNATNTREVLAKTRAKAVIQGYGSTEAGMVSMDDRDNFVPGSVGNVAPNTLLKVNKSRRPTEKLVISFISEQEQKATKILAKIAGAKYQDCR